MPAGTIPRKKRNQAMVFGGAVLLVIAFFAFHHPAPEAPTVTRNRSLNTQPTTTLSHEQVLQSSQQLAADTRAAIQHEQQLQSLNTSQFTSPINPAEIGIGTGQPAGQQQQVNAYGYQSGPAQTGPSPEQVRHEREVLLAKALHTSAYVPPTAMSG